MDATGTIPQPWPAWLASRPARWLLLALAAGISLPAGFASVPSVGLDPSWELSLQLAAIKGKVFGREFAFTYGPLGWLLLHFPVSKAGLLLFDFFMVGSLLSIYRRLLPERPRLLDAVVLVALAKVTGAGLSAGYLGQQGGPAAVLFAVLCHWLWRVLEQGDWRSVAGSLVAAELVVFSKVNYALILVFLMPAFGLGLWALHKNRRVAAGALLLGFPVLVGLGAALWRVDLPGYLHSAREFIAGYGEAMYLPVQPLDPGFDIACLFLVAMAVAAVAGRGCRPAPEQAVILPVVGLATLLLFKNSYVRFDLTHSEQFSQTFPILVAVWCVAWHNQSRLKILLFLSLLYPLVMAGSPQFGRNPLGPWLPTRYLREAAAAPGCETSRSLQNQLRATHLELVFPAPVRASLGAASADVMPWDSSLAVVNGLTLRQRPVPQSYATFTPWLDELNARFLASPNAPDFVLYACPQETATDGRPAAWDESLTKRAFLENYAYAFQFKLPLRTIHDTSTSAPVYVMKHWPGACQLAPVATNLVRMTLGQPWRVPETTNLLFLTLNVERTVAGRMQGLVLCPSPLVAVITYQDGTTNSYRAVLPVLKTGVLLNRRVESPPEIYHWLKLEADRNLAVVSICFTSTSPWAFAAEFAGTVVECRVVNNGGAARDVENPEP